MLNNINLVGRLTRDSEVRYTQNKKAVVSFTLAVTTGYNDFKRTDFIPVEAFSKEKLQIYLLKGKLVVVTGELHIDKYKGKNGENKSYAKIQAKDIILLEAKNQMQTPPNFEEVEAELPF